MSLQLFRPGPLFPPALSWGLKILALLIVFAVAAAWWDDLWDWLPWSAASRLAAAEASREAGADAASSALHESAGNAGQMHRVEAATRIIVETQAATEGLAAAARSASDASLPLDPGRLDRLRDHDRQLCRSRPGLVGCAAAPGPAGDGD